MFVFHETSMQGQLHCFFILTLAGNVGLPGVWLQASGGKQRGEQLTVREPFAIRPWICVEISCNYIVISFSFCWIVSFQSVWDIALMLKFSSYQYVVAGPDTVLPHSGIVCLVLLVAPVLAWWLCQLFCCPETRVFCLCLPVSCHIFFSLEWTLETLSRPTVTIQLYGLVECSLSDKHLQRFSIQILKIMVYTFIYIWDSAEVCGYVSWCLREVYWWEATVLIRKCVVALAAALFSVSYAPMLYLSSLLLIAAGRQLRVRPLCKCA